MPSTIKLIVGLGNPGSKYDKTRHNAGFWFLDRFASDHQCQFSNQSKFHGELARLNSANIDCWLLKPTTYMNESGRSVRAVAEYYSIKPANIFIVHDEIDLEPGTVRIKQGGGHGGHNGLRDIISQLGTNGFLRLRIGVGHPGERDKVIGSVLSKPSSEEQRLIDESIDQALAVMPLVMAGESQKAMTALHTDNK